MINEIITVTADKEAAAVRPDYESEIISVIRSKSSPKAAQTKLEDYHGSDIAQAIDSLTLQERKKLCRICSPVMLAEALEHLEEEKAAEFFSELDVKKAADVVEELDTDTAANILHTIEKQKRELIIEALPADVRRDVRLLASFDADEIGSKMTTDCIVIRENLTVPEAMAELVNQAKENDNIATVFVVDGDDEFYGAIELRDLLTAKKTVPLDDLILTSFPYVYAHESIDDCLEDLQDYSEAFIPGLDNGNRFLGIITSQSIVEVVDEEMGEDYAKLAGLIAEEDLKEPLLRSMKKRLPWLFILLGLGLVVSSVVGVFESVVSQLTMIMAFQSLILDMAGNVGTQSLAVTIRVLTDENLTFGQKMHLVVKETRVGFFNGVILGVISIIFVGLFIWLIKQKDFVFAFSVSGCIGISLLLAMAVSSAIGTLIPLFFKKIKIDPAVASGPLITTVNDLVAVVTYYGLSGLLLINLMNFSS